MKHWLWMIWCCIVLYGKRGQREFVFCFDEWLFCCSPRTHAPSHHRRDRRSIITHQRPMIAPLLLWISRQAATILSSHTLVLLLFVGVWILVQRKYEREKPKSISWSNHVTRGMPTMMLPSQNCLKRAALLIFIIYCSLTCSSGFQVVPAFRKQRNRRQLPFDVEVNSSIRRRTSLAPLSPIQGNNNAICMSGLALRNRKGTCSDYSLNLYRQSVNDVLEPQRSPLFEHYHSEFRLMLSSSSDDDDNKSPSSGKLRSFISKVFKSLVSPVVSFTLIACM